MYPYRQVNYGARPVPVQDTPYAPLPYEQPHGGGVYGGQPPVPWDIDYYRLVSALENGGAQAAVGGSEIADQLAAALAGLQQAPYQGGLVSGGLVPLPRPLPDATGIGQGGYPRPGVAPWQPVPRPMPEPVQRPYPVGGGTWRPPLPLPVRTPSPVGAGQGSYVVGGQVVNRSTPWRRPLPPPGRYIR